MRKDKSQKEPIEGPNVEIVDEINKILENLSITVTDGIVEISSENIKTSSINSGWTFSNIYALKKLHLNEYKLGKGPKILLRLCLSRDDYENALGDLTEAYNRDFKDPNIGPKLARIVFYKSLLSFIPAAFTGKFRNIFEIVIGAITKQIN